MFNTDKTTAQSSDGVADLHRQDSELSMIDSEHTQTETELRHQVALEKLLLTLATRFIRLRPDEVDEGLNEALRALGEFAGADRCYTYLLSDDAASVVRANQWCAEGIAPWGDDAKVISVEFLAGYIARLRQNEIINIPSLKKEDREEQLEGDQWQLYDSQSVLIVPLNRRENMSGLIGFDTVRIERAWTERDVELLTRFSEIFVTTLDRLEIDQEQRLSEERFRRVFSSISDHIYVTEITETGDHINLYISPHVEGLTHYTVEALMADWSLWPEKIIHPGDRSVAAEQAARLAQGENSEVDYRLIRADEKVIWVRDRATVKREGKSRIVYGLVTDITQQKLVELEREWLTNELKDINYTLDERVWARTAELQAIIDAVGEGIVVTDLDGVIQYLNPALEQLTGFTEAEALGKTPSLWKSNQHDSMFFSQMWQTILSNQSWRGEIVNKRKDGSLYEAVLTITPITGLEGQPLGFVGVQHDITPFREMDRLKTEFISTAAHELRTPLTSIQGFSEILLFRELDEDRQARYLTFINQQAEALAAIIDDLLDLSRLEAGEGFEIQEVLVDVKKIMGQVIFGFQESHPGHRYHLSGISDWPSIKGDPTKLSQLFKNLISNATKYSPHGGDISCKAEVEDQYKLLHITVSDQGIGMTREQIDHVFERFYRADASNTAAGGTGLGMTISRLIVELHGGKIWVESEYDVGTTVHIQLPLPDRPAYVLVIEDDEVLQEIQQRHLQLQGFAVLTADEGQSGLELARTCLPNLILLDLALPRVTGFTVLNELQVSNLTEDIPVIITSALDRPEEIEQAVSNGVVDFLVKPYTMNDLTVRVNRALAKARRETRIGSYS